MEKELIKILPGELTGDVVENELALLNAYGRLEELKALTKKFKENLDRVGVEYMKANNIKSIAFDNENELVITTDKTNWFNTKRIYELLEFTEDQIKVLPKNPAFKKTFILPLQEIHEEELCWEDVKDKLKLSKINKLFIDEHKRSAKAAIEKARKGKQ